MAAEFAPRGIRFVFVYTREAHPGVNWPHHRSIGDKLAHARKMAARDGIARPLLVDDLDGTVHTAYGQLPNMAWILHRGRIVYKASWTDARSVRDACERVAYELDARAKKLPLAPFHVEMLQHRVRDRPAFMEGLLEAGPTAVDEFIAATIHMAGEGPAREMIAWWEARKKRDG